MKSSLLLTITVLVFHVAYPQCGSQFLHGVASGDPLTDRVIIWTRITPDAGMMGSLQVNWRMATDTGMTNIVKTGSVFTSAAVDYTLKADVTGLVQNTYYYYDFEFVGRRSVRGRTHTMPVSGTATQRFAQVSCANWEDGYFNAYKRITARNDISAVIFLGDYVYEFKSGDYSSNIPGRINSPLNECITVADYRKRYAQYRLDPDLANCHQQYPWFIVWDDHEFADNAWLNGADNHQPATEGTWTARKANAMQAWREWLPVRMPDLNDLTRIYRKSSVGSLINFYFWDGRTKRAQQLAYNAPGFNDTSRHMLGNTQVNWFLNDISTSTAKWNIVCQQDMMAPCKVFGIPVNTDSWDGYPAERNTLITELKNRNINNLVVLTGDFHSSWGNDIPRSNYNWLFNTNAAGVEFVSPSVTSQSSSFPVSPAIIKTFNPHVQFVDLDKHGYLVINVTSTRVTGEWWYVNTITQPSDLETFGAAYYVDGAQRHLKSGSMTASIQVTSPRAPACPIPTPPASFASGEQPLDNNMQNRADVYPNPFTNNLMVQYNAGSNEEIVASLFDMQGRLLLQKKYAVTQKANTRLQLTTENIPAGTYILKIQQGAAQVQKIVVKQYGY